METIEKGNEGNVYEVSFLLLPSLGESQVSSSFDSIGGIIKGLDGAVISLEAPVLIDLAYPMTKVVGAVRHKVTAAYFGWIKFEIESGEIEKVKKALDLNNEVVRYLVIKTVRENTLLNGKMMFKKEGNGPEESYDSDEQMDIPEATKETAPEELDKSIDDLVIA